MSHATQSVPIEKIDGLRSTHQNDVLAIEEALEIRLGTRSLSVTMRTPGSDFELVAGFLLAEGIIANADEIREMRRPPDGNPNIVEVHLSAAGAALDAIGGSTVDLDAAQRNFVMSSACGMCGKSSLDAIAASRTPVLGADSLRIAPELVHSLPDLLRRQQALFDCTGGLHAAALFTMEGELQAVREDVGRHNAVDKLLGDALLQRRLPLRESILLVSGRAGFELVQKALVAGIPIMAAVGAPSSLAVATAARCGMTLVGFLRDSRFNVYSGAQRIASMEKPQ